MKLNKFSSFILLLLSILFYTGCGIKPGSGGKSSRYFETFYAGSENGTQYFIKPVDFADANRQGAAVDFTLRDANFKQDSATVNYTLTTNSQLPTDQAIIFVDAADIPIFQTTKVERLFQERTKTGFLARYTSKVANPELASAFSQTNSKLRIVLANGEMLVFLPSGKAKKAMQEVDRNLFSLY